ncbi:hypothetical protein SFR_5214 [Streptomyces sp. FR-008]|nr:hypothetical protein SFR_5214 [Streptomyces sp. FR-008]
MVAQQPLLQGRVAPLGGLEVELPFAGVLDRALPAVDRGHGADDLYAGGETGLDGSGGQRLGPVGGVDGRDDDERGRGRGLLRGGHLGSLSWGYSGSSG